MSNMKNLSFRYLYLLLGKKWHDRRKVITPAFHFKILEKFVETFDRLGDAFMDKLYEFETENSIELYHFVTRYTLDVMCGKLKIDYLSNFVQ